MGGSSSSSNTTFTQTENYNFQGNEGPAIAGDGNTVNITDGGAFAFAESFGGAVLDNNLAVIDETLSTIQTVNSDSLDLADSMNRDSLYLARELHSEGLSFAGNLNRDSLDLAGSMFSEMKSFGDNSLQVVADQSRSAMDIAERTTRSDSTVMFGQMTKYMGGGFVLLLLVLFLMNRGKK